MYKRAQQTAPAASPGAFRGTRAVAQPAPASPSTAPVAFRTPTVAPVANDPLRRDVNKTSIPAAAPAAGTSGGFIQKSNAVVSMQNAMFGIYTELQKSELFDPSTHSDPGSVDEHTHGISKFLSPLIDREFGGHEKEPGSVKGVGNHNKSWGVVERMKQLGAIGAQGKLGRVADGIWGTATQKGLAALGDIISAFAQVGQKVDIGDNGLTIKDAQQFRSLIPSTEEYSALGAKGLNERAEQITKVLNILQEKISLFAAHFFGNQDDVQTGLAPKLDTGYGKAREVNTNVAGFNTYVLSGLREDPSSKNAIENVRLSDLADPKSFHDFLTRNNISFNKQPVAGNPILTNQYLDYIKSELGKSIKLVPGPNEAGY